MYLAVALIVGIIAVLAVSFYYEIQQSNGQTNPDSIPVATVIVTAVVTVTVPPSTTTCSNNQTNLSNQTVTC